MRDLKNKINPGWMKSNINNKEPKRTKPNTGRARSGQMKPRKNTLLPTLKRSNIKAEDSGRVSPKTNKVSSRHAKLFSGKGELIDTRSRTESSKSMRVKP